MRTVYGLGETVLDIIFKNGQPISAKAGGSVLNALVSLARLGHQVSFISELGKDKVGDVIVDFLSDNSIDSSLIKRYDDGQSSLALAFLNQNNDAEYDFYKNYPHERLNIELPDFKKDDVFLFGSFYAITSQLRSQVNRIVKHAVERGCIIIYDPNFRKNHAKNLDELLTYVVENIETADVVRGSDEDFANIFVTQTSEEAYNKICPLCDNLVYTQNAKGVYLHTQGIKKHYPVGKVNPVSTIGAGDNFNAGIIHSLLQQNISKEQLSQITEQQWDETIKSGIRLSSEVCMSLDNYISKP